jgi:hypothetical protein
MTEKTVFVWQCNADYLWAHIRNAVLQNPHYETYIAIFFIECMQQKRNDTPNVKYLSICVTV